MIRVQFDIVPGFYSLSSMEWRRGSGRGGVRLALAVKS
jgi:hypothetical protein